MKKVFYPLLALLFCAPVVFAEPENNGDPLPKADDLLPPYSTLSFDLTKTSPLATGNLLFSLEKEKGEPGSKNEKNPSTLLGSECAFLGLNGLSSFLPASYTHWHLYKANFGLEKVYVRFPYSPAISQSSNLIVTHAYEYDVLYTLTGYFPPI